MKVSNVDVRMQQIDVPAHVVRIGSRIHVHWKQIGEKHGVPVQIPDNYPCFAQFRIKHEKSAAPHTLYTRLMLEQGFLTWHTIYPTLGHTGEIAAKYAEVMDVVFARIAEILAQGRMDEIVGGQIAHAGFKRLI